MRLSHTESNSSIAEAREGLSTFSGTFHIRIVTLRTPHKAEFSASHSRACFPATADGQREGDADAGAAGATSRGQTGLLWSTDRERGREAGRKEGRGGRRRGGREGNLVGVEGRQRAAHAPSEPVSESVGKSEEWEGRFVSKRQRAT